MYKIGEESVSILEMTRVCVGLPEDGLWIPEMPGRTRNAFIEGRINESDLEHNVYARLRQNDEPDIEPPLSPLERDARTKVLAEAAKRCVVAFLTESANTKGVRPVFTKSTSASRKGSYFVA